MTSFPRRTLVLTLPPAVAQVLHDEAARGNLPREAIAVAALASYLGVATPEVAAWLVTRPPQVAGVTQTAPSTPTARF